jgi:hypothetical protein
MRHKKVFQWVLLWGFAILITGAAIVYQNLTGPTHPKRIDLRLAREQQYSLKLPRSHGGETDCPVELSIADTTVSGDLYCRRYPTNEAWQQIPMKREGGKLTGFLPHQPPAGKLEYYIQIRQAGQVYRVPYGELVVIRFRGDVPANIILPHVFCMFFSMLLSNLTLLLALFNFRQYRLYGWITTAVLCVGGLILGPLVQFHAFGQYWTGFPFGFDLTDNKTLIAIVFWFVAIAGNLKKDRRYLTVLAGLVMLVIFSIPHSARGSQLDPDTGKIKTGMVNLPKLPSA